MKAKVNSSKVKRIIAIFLVLACTALSFVACKSEKNNDDTTSSAAVSGNISTNGSTSMEEVIGILSETFMKENPSVNVSYDATGSGSGIEAVKNGTADIGLSSRDLKDEEKSAGLTQKTIALDGIVVIVNNNNPVSDLSLEQIKKLYTGEIKNWKEVGGKDSPVSCVGREAGSGTRDGFETITDAKDKCKMDQELTSTGAVIEAVKGNENAVGYASFSAVEGKSEVKALTVGKIPCSEKTISDGSYKIQRDFNLITKTGKKLSPQAQAFYDYCVSKNQSSLVERAGVVSAVK